MLIIMLILNWMFSMIFMFLSHPLSMGCILLIQTILICLSSGLLYMNFWFSYILFLIMIGGMLVMFIYMTSIASNEMFKMPKNMMIWNLTMLLIIICTLIFMDFFFSNFMDSKIINFNQSFKLNILTLNKFFNYPNLQMMITMMIYLLVTLIATVKIVGKNFGSLRQK